MHDIYEEFEFGQIRPPTMELSALDSPFWFRGRGLFVFLCSGSCSLLTCYFCHFETLLDQGALLINQCFQDFVR